MSAIAGIYYLDGQPVDCADLGRMVDTLDHRGPDGSAIWSEGSVGLGHRMLWTTPESLLEELPLVERRSDLVITADARIDNRDELIAALSLSDRPAEKITDSQLILASYEKWGECCSEHLLGDFAFAIWDKRKQLLLAARDHLGVKPFYYYHCPGSVFVFASEIKALFCLSQVPRRLNEVRVGDYLEGMFEDKFITFYQDILRLPPAHILVASCQGIRLQQYWALDRNYELHLSSDAEYAQAYREIFTEAVHCRLRSAFPVGSMLSGGLDSSSITCVARDLLAESGRQPLPTFSLIFDRVTECDERPYINAVLAQGGLEPHYVHGDQLNPLGDIDKILWHQDEPFYVPNLFLHRGMYESAQQQGVRILLDGFVGDSTVSYGLKYLIDLARAARWLTLIHESEAAARRCGFPRWSLTRRYIWNYGIRPQVPELLRQVWRRLRRRNLPAATSLSPIVNPDFAERINLSTRVRAFQQDRSQWVARDYHHKELSTADLSSALEVINNASSEYYLESRFPFTDKRLVEFCLAIPQEQKLHNGWTRTIVRRALRNCLPEKVCWRTDKGNLAPNFNQGLFAFERERLEELILERPQVLEAYLNVPLLQEVYQRCATQESDVEVETVWLAAILGLWFRDNNLD